MTPLASYVLLVFMLGVSLVCPLFIGLICNATAHESKDDAYIACSILFPFVLWFGFAYVRSKTHHAHKAFFGIGMMSCFLSFILCMYNFWVHKSRKKMTPSLDNMKKVTACLAVTSLISGVACVYTNASTRNMISTKAVSYASMMLQSTMTAKLLDNLSQQVKQFIEKALASKRCTIVICPTLQKTYIVAGDVVRNVMYQNKELCWSVSNEDVMTNDECRIAIEVTKPVVQNQLIVYALVQLYLYFKNTQKAWEDIHKVLTGDPLLQNERDVINVLVKHKDLFERSPSVIDATQVNTSDGTCGSSYMVVNGELDGKVVSAFDILTSNLIATIGMNTDDNIISYKGNAIQQADIVSISDPRDKAFLDLVIGKHENDLKNMYFVKQLDSNVFKHKDVLIDIDKTIPLIKDVTPQVILSYQKDSPYTKQNNYGLSIKRVQIQTETKYAFLKGLCRLEIYNPQNFKASTVAEAIQDVQCTEKYNDIFNDTMFNIYNDAVGMPNLMRVGITATTHTTHLVSVNFNTTDEKLIDVLAGSCDDADKNTIISMFSRTKLDTGAIAKLLGGRV